MKVTIDIKRKDQEKKEERKFKDLNEVFTYMEQLEKLGYKVALLTDKRNTLTVY